jgi:hypothetical protein
MLGCGFGRVLLVAVALTFGFWTSHAAAQPRHFLQAIGLEVAPVGGVPVGAFARGDPGLGATAGPGVDAGASARVGRRYAVYGAAQYVGFGCGECPDFGFDSTARDVGFEAGAEVRFQMAALRPWARVGALAHQLQLRDDPPHAASRVGWGFAAALGSDYPLGRGISLSPSLAFRSYRAVFPLETFADQSATVRYAAARLGLRYQFGAWLTP